ncbi:uncharacterized protein LOC108625128 [Ceratina calcarata]|uniref:Uncharacterized protein LOC108625128 n=1 Tax=Ceratina calcarata TaxID=156304 RepID=A0AAJ7IYS9_9HYME|nr:uncharacterized protein LOC108625128 [Ceratina calcarata]
MVLIIRNNRILSSRHPKFKRLFSYMNKSQQKQSHKEISSDQSKDQVQPVMSFVGVLSKLFLYSCAMFTLPFASFFGVQHIMNTEFHVDRFVTNCISVSAAVITVNLIIAFYIYQAFQEPNDETITDDHSSKESLNEKID